MAFLRKNLARAVLAGNITATSSALTVSNSSLPTESGEMRLIIWDYSAYPDPMNDPHYEIITASYVSGNNYSITRGQENTTATTHYSGERIALHYTAGMSEDDLYFIGGYRVDETNIAANKLLVVTTEESDGSGDLFLHYTDTPSFSTLNVTEIKTDAVEPTDLSITTGADKTLVLNTPVWDDLRITPGSFDRPGTSDPTYRLWQPGGSGTTFEILKFNQGQYAFFTIQLPHTYKTGEDIYVHMHWTPGNRGVTEGTATVAWKLDYSWASIGAVFGASVTADCTDACQSTNDQHLMTPEVVIDGDGKGISSMLICKIYRDSGDTWSGTNANGPALLEVDFHFPINTLGSRQIDAK